MTLEEFYLYNIRVRDIKLQAAIADSIPTEEQFWQAAYDYPESKLVDYLASERVGPITVGKLYGETMLKLLPSIDVLSAAPLDPEPSLDFAATDSGAIYYADGHPTKQILSSTAKASPPTSHQMAYEQNSGLTAPGASLGASPKPSVRQIQSEEAHGETFERAVRFRSLPAGQTIAGSTGRCTILIPDPHNRSTTR